MDLRETFETISASLVADYGMTKTGEHRGIKGDKREVLVRQFLSETLPRSCEIRSGEIFNEGGSISNQVDIIVHNASMPALKSPKLRLFPVKSVIATCEVKTYLDKERLEEAVLNISNTKALSGTPDPRTGSPRRPIYGAVFAFDGEGKVIKDNLLELYKKHSIKEEHSVDLICVLNKYVGLGYPGGQGLVFDKEHETLTKERAVFIECGKDSLLYFLIILLDRVSMQTSQPSSLWEYLRPAGHVIF
jgi:hypothetical protein